MSQHDLEHRVVPVFQKKLTAIFGRGVGISFDYESFALMDDLYDMIGGQALPTLVAFLASSLKRRQDAIAFYKENIDEFRFAVDNSLSQINITKEGRVLTIHFTVQYLYGVDDNLNYRLGYFHTKQKS